MTIEKNLKLILVKRYLEEHSECSEREACRIFNASNIDYHRFKKNNFSTLTRNEMKRAILKPLIQRIYDEDGTKPGAEPICKKLNALGYKCSIPLVLSLTKELGIAYHPFGRVFA